VSLPEDLEALKKLVAECDADIGKAEKGQGAPGSRLRKVLQAIKMQAHVMRQTVLERRKGPAEDEG
jgi:hypothetical protein